MKKIYIASIGANEGKTTAGIAIALKYRNVGYMKPLGNNPVYMRKKFIDFDALLFSNLFGSGAAENLSLGVNYSKIMHNYKDAIEELKRRYEEMAKGKDIFIFEGAENIWKGASLHLDMNSIIENMELEPVFVVSGDENEIMDKIAFIASMKNSGIIINRAKEDILEKAEKMANVVGYIPEIRKLRLTKVSYIVNKLNGKVVAGSAGLDNYFDGVFIAALSANQIKRHPDFKKKNKLIITGGDRSDAITACIEENTAAIILTNNIIPSSNILAKADKAEIPLISVRPDTYTIAKRIEEIPRIIMPEEREKVEEIRKKAKVEI